MPTVSLTTIEAVKGQPITYQPLLLAKITFTDGSILRLCTHGLRTADGGFQYGGQDWFPRILNQDIAMAQALSDQGVDFVPNVSLKLADADKFIENNYSSAKGFKGASMELIFVFWSVDTSTFSSNSRVRFRGICQPETDADEESVTVTAVSKMNFGTTNLPTHRVQKRCGWNFPTTAAQRQAGADDEDSQFFNCGYSPDATGSNKRGDFETGTTPFTTCNRTKEDCVARGMYSEDHLVQITGRFSGIQWAPTESFQSRGFVSSKVEEIVRTGNEAKYGDFIPIVYGTQRIEPLVLNVTGDANLTKMEVLLCAGQIQRIHDVVVNDVRIPHADDDTFMSTHKEGGNTISGWWKIVNEGDRSGLANPDALYDSLGDPYGGFAVIAVVVPRKLAEASSVPRVSVWFDGPKIRVYSDPTTFTKIFTSNPAWIIMDLLVKANWRYDELDVQTFIDAANVCDATIDYVNQHGVTGPHQRYTAGLTIRQRRTAADVLRGMRNCAKMLIVPHYADDGKLQLLVRQTLAEQQPAPDTDNSNDTDPYTSSLADGTTEDGYVLWHFTEADYIKRNKKSTFRLISRQDQAPNRLSVQFQNRDNRNAIESVAIVDTEDVTRMDQELPGTMQVDGADNFDQIYRVYATLFAEGYRGNARPAADATEIGDTGGTKLAEFETTFKALHLKLGDLVAVSHQGWNLDKQLFRVMKVQPTTNSEIIKFTLMWHNDFWYWDTFGQLADPRWRPAFRNKLVRPAFSWAPFGTQPEVDDVWLDREDWNFAVGARAEVGADNTALLTLDIGGDLLVNTPPSEPPPPFCDAQGSTASTGGDFPGDRVYFIAVCAKDQAGAEYRPSALSRLCTVAVPAGTNTNTITITGLVWDASAEGYVVFAGTDPNKLTYQDDDDTTPTSITITDYKPSTFNAPDTEFDRLKIRVKRVLHSGPWATTVVECTSSSITVAVYEGDNAGFVIDAYDGYDLSLLAMVDETGPLPIANWTITGNDRDTLDVDGPDPTAIVRPSGGTGLMAGDVVVLRSKPTIGSDADGNYLEDEAWINPLNVLEEAYEVADAQDNGSGEIQLTLGSPTPWSTGDFVYVQGVGGTTEANDLWQVTVIDDTHADLDGSVFSNAYTSGGQASRRTVGLVDDQERGRTLRFVHGPAKGTWSKIKSNVQVSGAERIYIEGEWPITPTGDSRYIIEEPAWQTSKETVSGNVERFGVPAVVSVDISNYRNQTLLIQALTLDGGNTESNEGTSPVREIYSFGGAGTLGFTGAIHMTVDGTLAIGSNLAPIAFIKKDARAVAFRAEVKTAPTGADLVINVYIGPTLWSTLTMAAGTTYIEASPTALAAAPDLTANTQITLDITAVGTTFRGADLSAIIFI